MSERERERERQTDRQTDRQTETETDRDRQRQRQRETESEKDLLNSCFEDGSLLLVAYSSNQSSLVCLMHKYAHIKMTLQKTGFFKETVQADIFDIALKLSTLTVTK